MRTFNLWPEWTKNIEQVRLTVPSGPHKWFHTPSLSHHPGMDHWWKLFRIGIAPHHRYMLIESDKSKGWNIWFYFRGGAALCFEFSIVRGMPRLLAHELGLPREVGDKFIARSGEKRFLAQALSRLDDVP